MTASQQTTSSYIDQKSALPDNRFHLEIAPMGKQIDVSALLKVRSPAQAQESQLS